MTTLDLILALTVALARNDVDATAQLLDALEARLPPDELADLLEALLGGEAHASALRPVRHA